MANAPKKVAVIGLDCALPHLIEKHIADGHLPTFKKLIEGGVIADNCLVPFPTVTPPNWATIATGAWPGTHQVTDFHVQLPGTTPSNANIVQAFSSERWQAEAIWEAMDKAGEKAIVVNFPGAWPSRMKNGIMVGGGGLTPIEQRDGKPFMNIVVDFCNEHLITTGVYPGAVRGRFQPLLPGKEWANAKEMGEEPLELEAPMVFHGAEERPAPCTWYVLARQADDGYDRITLSPSRDLAEAFCTLALGEWSPRIVTRIAMIDGSSREVFFRVKLLELSADAEDFRLFITAMAGTSAWISPPEAAKDIESAEGAFAGGGGMRALAVGWVDLDTYVELNDLYSQWLADAAVSLLTKNEWRGFFMHSHPPDWVYHILITEMDPNTCPDEARRKTAWDIHLKVYETQDRMLAKILTALDKDTMVVLVSDHGATPDGPMIDPYKILVPAGLTAMLEDLPDTPARTSVGEELRIATKKPDPDKSKALPQREIYVYVNLKGRDPEGIVDPADYEKVQQEIIDALYAYVDPKTGRRPVALALAKKDARILGLYGDQVGDVVYALYPWFGSQHGQILPTGEWGVGSLKGLLVLHGPGLKKGYRLQRTCGITDLVPTICYLLDLPVPEHAEGAVLYQAFKDPNFKLKEIQKLKDGLARMETALARQEREPWDKHDCA